MLHCNSQIQIPTRYGHILWFNFILDLCMGISDKIEVATIAIDEAKILEI